MKGVLGNRFRPTEEEIMCYLTLKKSGHQFPVPAIKEVDIRNHKPWELPEKSIIRDDQVWYFFSALSKKYANSNLVDRATRDGTGYWKITAKDHEVKDNITEEVIGIRKTLVFYKRRNRGAIRTRWGMHEYHSRNSAFSENEVVLCRLEFKFHDKSAALPDEATKFWPLNFWYGSPQNMGAPENCMSPAEIGELPESDWLWLQKFLHPEQGSSPSDGSNNEVNIRSSQLEDMNEQDDDFVNSPLICLKKETLL